MYKIIQSSYGGTGSTLLINLIYGFLEPQKPVKFRGYPDVKDNKIIKFHEPNFDKLIKNLKNYKIFIIASERNKKYEEKYYNRNNILIIKYCEILETEKNSLENICNNMYEKLSLFLPKELQLNTTKQEILNNMINRIKKMNETVEIYKSCPNLKTNELDMILRE